MKQIPALSHNLIKQMDEDEPKLVVKPTMNQDDIMYKAGRRSIIDELIYRQEYYENENKSQ